MPFPAFDGSDTEQHVPCSHPVRVRSIRPASQNKIISRVALHLAQAMKRPKILKLCTQLCAAWKTCARTLHTLLAISWWANQPHACGSLLHGPCLQCSKMEARMPCCSPFASWSLQHDTCSCCCNLPAAMQGIDMFGRMRSPDGTVDPSSSANVTAEFKHEWEVPLQRQDSKSSFNHDLIGLDFIFCWTFRFPKEESNDIDPEATAAYLRDLSKDKRIVDMDCCTGRICTSFADYQGSSVLIPDSLRGCAFLIDDIRDSNDRKMNPVQQRMGHSCIRVVSLKGLLEATFNQPPQSSISWAPQQLKLQSSPASLSSSPAASTRPTTSACMQHSKVQKAPASIYRLQKTRLPQTLLLRSQPLQRHSPCRFGLASQNRSPPHASGASMPSRSPSRGITFL